MYSRYIQHGNLSPHKYQEEGISWCLNKEQDIVPEKTTGAILADEMGLGKTITMLGVIALNINFYKHTLIVVPPALLDQWAKQCAIILGHVPFVFYGPHIKYIDSIPKDAYIVITTYGTMFNKTITNNKWDRIIYDEAHHMRNAKTRNYQAGNKLCAKFKWMLTGTPLQNKRRDLYSLLELIHVPKENYMVEENRPQLLQNYMLRRTKASVGLEKQMPPLKISPHMVKWSDPNEKRASEDIHELLSFSNVKPCDRPSSINELLSTMPPIVLLLKAKQMCTMGAYNKTKQPVKKSSKLSSVLAHLISNKNDSSKKLIFCHFRNEMDAIYDYLQMHQINVSKIDGRIPSKKARAEVLNNMATDVLLLQIRVGCEGLNLQQYNEVYFVSPTWNPFVEDQAIARCYRLGQTKPVNVHRFYMQGFDQSTPTISQDMYTAQVQNTKKNIEKEILM